MLRNDRIVWRCRLIAQRRRGVVRDEALQKIVRGGAGVVMFKSLDARFSIHPMARKENQ